MALTFLCCLKIAFTLSTKQIVGGENPHYGIPRAGLQFTKER